MPYPRRLLQDDEDVVFDAHPHWIALVKPVIVVAVVIAGCAVIFIRWTSAPTWVGIALGVLIVIAVGYFLSRFVVWRSRMLVVTSKRVISRVGVIRRFGKEIPIARVQDVTYHQSLVERMVGAGSLIIESAGDRGIETIHKVRTPEDLQTLINRMAADFEKATVSGKSDSDVPKVADAPRFMTQMEQLDELRRRGILTEHEFAQKKAELLQEL